MFLQYQFHAFGGPFKFCCVKATNDDQLWSKVCRNIEVNLQAIEEKWSVYKEQSEISKINLKAGEEFVSVSKETFAIIEKAISYSKITKGHFDLTYYPVKHYLESCKLKKVEPSLLKLNELKKVINFNNILLNKEKKSVMLKHKKMKISLGGIGKGYAIDFAFNFFIKSKTNNFLINGNGDLRAHSTPQAKRPWYISLKNPLNSKISIACLPLKNTALATSSAQFQYFGKSKSFDHLYSKDKVLDFLSVSILSHNALQADVYATSIYTMKKEEALSFLNQNKLGYILVDKNKKVHTHENNTSLSF